MKKLLCAHDELDFSKIQIMQSVGNLTGPWSCQRHVGYTNNSWKFVVDMRLLSLSLTAFNMVVKTIIN